MNYSLNYITLSQLDVFNKHSRPLQFSRAKCANYFNYSSSMASLLVLKLDFVYLFDSGSIRFN